MQESKTKLLMISILTIQNIILILNGLFISISNTTNFYKMHIWKSILIQIFSKIYTCSKKIAQC